MAFLWPVNEVGFVWKHSQVEGQGPVLVALRPWPRRLSEPLSEKPALFRDFADLDPSSKAMLEFANLHGHLSGFVWTTDSLEDPNRITETEGLNESLISRCSGGIAEAAAYPETEAFWLEQIGEMKVAVELWDGIRSGTSDPDLMKRVAEAIELGTAQRCEHRFRYDSRTRRSGWAREPLNLLGGMWVQFAEAVEAGRDYRKCPVCYRWFELAPGRARSDKLHCGLPCRQRAYRDRKRASDLQKQGWTVEEIAEEMGLDVATVHDRLGPLNTQGFPDERRSRRNIEFDD